MDFKENVRWLRKQKRLTQEEMAEQLSVSFQTVSKWENGVSMPDIGMLPLLADYFEISIDELLGHRANNRTEKAGSIAQKAHSMAENGCLLEAYQFLKSEAKRFKMDIGIQHLLGYLAYRCGKETEGDESIFFLDIAIKQAELVVRLDQNDGSRTAQAKMLKCYCLKEMGNRSMALEIAEKLPSIFSAREVALFRCADGQEKRQYAAVLENYLEELQREVSEER